MYKRQDPDRPSRYNLAAYAEIDRYKPSHLIYESGVLLLPVTVTNSSLLLLHSLAVLIRADNFNLIATRFDGWEKFNGARQFGLVEHRRPRLHAVESSFAAENRSRQGILLNVMGSSTVKYGKGWRMEVSLPARNKGDVRVSAVVTGAAAHSLNTTKLAVEKDTQWYFDGTYCFDGTRRFNAGIQKEVL